MEAGQRQCLWCTNYNVETDTCKRTSIEGCVFNRGSKRRKPLGRRNPKDAFRDLFGEHVGEEKPLKQKQKYFKERTH